MAGFETDRCGLFKGTNGAPTVALERPMSTERGMAYGGRPLWSRSPKWKREVEMTVPEDCRVRAAIVESITDLERLEAALSGGRRCDGSTFRTRALGIPTGPDKLLQEAIHMILEAYYEPFSDREGQAVLPLDARRRRESTTTDSYAGGHRGLEVSQGIVRPTST